MFAIYILALNQSRYEGIDEMVRCLNPAVVAVLILALLLTATLSSLCTHFIQRRRTWPDFVKSLGKYWFFRKPVNFLLGLDDIITDSEQWAHVLIQWF